MRISLPRRRIVRVLPAPMSLVPSLTICLVWNTLLLMYLALRQRVQLVLQRHQAESLPLVPLQRLEASRTVLWQQMPSLSCPVVHDSVRCDPLALLPALRTQVSCGGVQLRVVARLEWMQRTVMDVRPTAKTDWALILLQTWVYATWGMMSGKVIPSRRSLAHQQKRTVMPTRRQGVSRA